MPKVLVIGDGCKDVFRYGKCERICPEAPVPVFLPEEEKANGGMAVNVYNNLKALEIDCDILTNSGITKTRLVDSVSNQMLLRIDENDTVPVLQSDVLEAIDFSSYDAVVISDYNKGYLCEDQIQFIANSHPLVFMDTKKIIGEWAENVKFIKINKKEYDYNIKNSSYLSYKYKNNIVVTLGKDGAMLINGEKKQVFPIEEEHHVRDLSGAGDTFLAGLVATYLRYPYIDVAIRYANDCAAWAVSQKGVTIIDWSKS